MRRQLDGQRSAIQAVIDMDEIAVHALFNAGLDWLAIPRGALKRLPRSSGKRIWAGIPIARGPQGKTFRVLIVADDHLQSSPQSEMDADAIVAARPVGRVRRVAMPAVQRQVGTQIDFGKTRLARA